MVRSRSSRIRRFVSVIASRGAGGDPPGELDRPRHQLVGRVDGADDPHAQSAVGVEQPAGERELGGQRRRQRGARRRVARRDPARQLGEAEARCLGRQPQVAEQGQREAAGEGGAVDGGDHRPGAVRRRPGSSRCSSRPGAPCARGRRRTGSCPSPSRRPAALRSAPPRRRRGPRRARRRRRSARPAGRSRERSASRGAAASPPRRPRGARVRAGRPSGASSPKLTKEDR